MPNQFYKLELFFYYQCYYCQLVLNQIDELNLDIELCNVFENSSFRKKLYNDTGRNTVPCLYIDDKPMFESKDIIKWLDSNKDAIRKKN